MINWPNLGTIRLADEISHFPAEEFCRDDGWREEKRREGGREEKKKEEEKKKRKRRKRKGREEKEEGKKEEGQKREKEEFERRICIVRKETFAGERDGQFGQKFGKANCETKMGKGQESRAKRAKGHSSLTSAAHLLTISGPNIYG